MSKKPRQGKKSPEKIKRSDRALERAVEPAPVMTDDPARDKTEMEGSVLQPLPHAD